MTIKFNCPKCKKELSIKDEMAGKQGKCPGCQSMLKVPAPAAVPRPAPPPQKKPVEEVVAEVEEEEVVAEVEDEEDEPPRKKKKPVREDEEDEDDRKAAITSTKRTNRPRNDEEEDEDDRPSRRSRRRDDEDEDDEDRPRYSRKEERLWLRTRTGVLLNMIGSWFYTGAWGLLFLAFVLTLVMVGAGVGGPMGFDPFSMRGAGGLLVILSYLCFALYVVHLILWVVGPCLCISTPGRHGETGLAIVGLVLTVLALLMVLLAFVAPGQYMIYVWPALELGRLTLFGIFHWAVGASMRDRKASGSALKTAIVTPSSAILLGIIFWVMVSMVIPKMGEAGFYLAIIVPFLILLTWDCVLGWYTLSIARTRDAI
jgi:hypothetical protein